MSKNEVKQEIKNMEKYDINKLNKLSNQSGISLMVLSFWYNAFHN